MTDPVHLGTFDCPSGVLVILDPGLAHHWERRGVPERQREPLFDLGFEGPDTRRSALEDGEPARFLERHEPTRREDSGWTISSGAEREDEPNFVVLPIAQLTARYPEFEELLAEPVGAGFSLVGEAKYERER